MKSLSLFLNPTPKLFSFDSKDLSCLSKSIAGGEKTAFGVRSLQTEVECWFARCYCFHTLLCIDHIVCNAVLNTKSTRYNSILKQKKFQKLSFKWNEWQKQDRLSLNTFNIPNQPVIWHYSPTDCNFVSCYKLFQVHVVAYIVQELCETWGGHPGLSVLTRLLVSADVKQYWTMLTHWFQLVPNMSTDIQGH